jgi:Fur family ferric uptake transcriptional regulator
MNDLSETLRGRGKRMTAQREQILRAVETRGHATPGEVLAEAHKHASSINI